ncbi:MAG: hypothetical protein QXG05_02100 [Nitrososphaerota archaeon]
MELNGDVEFVPVQEPWNTYLLEDGTKLKIRLIVLRIIAVGADSSGNPKFTFGNQVLAVARAPTQLKGVHDPKRDYSHSSIAKSVVLDNIPFKAEGESWNVYDLPDGSQIRAKVSLIKVARTDLYEEQGDPVYLTSTRIEVEYSSPQS